MTLETALSVRHVEKAFPGVRALADFSMDVGGGEVVAVVGENGAGKSTLLKILCGDYHRDGGDVTIAGADIANATPREMRNAGFRLVRQEPEIVPDIAVAENIFIGEYPARRGRVDFSRMRAATLDLLAQYGFDGLIDVDALGRTLSPAQRHIVEIIRALKPGVGTVAFDEPTSSLTADETKRLFELIGRLRADGRGVIYVSHRLQEVMEVSDRIVVMRDGRLAGVLQTADAEEAEVVRLMVGRDLAGGFARTETTTDRVVLEVENLSSRWHKNVSLTVRAGEVLGLAGLVGAGRSELAKVLFGEYPHSGGVIRIDGKVVRIRQPAQAIAAGIGFSPEDRKSEGLIMVRSVLENASVAVFSKLARLGVLRRPWMTERVVPLVRALDIKTPSLDQEVSKLSGGNQQKVVLARWLAAEPRLLILDEPTRAVDVGAKAEIYRLIDQLARQGMAILMISSEMPELLGLADRIMVMRDGGLSPPIEKAHATEELILNHALGVTAA